MSTPTSYQQLKISNINDNHDYKTRHGINQLESFDICTQFSPMINDEFVTNSVDQNHEANYHINQSISFDMNSFAICSNQLMSNLGNNDNEMHTHNTYEDFHQSQINIYQPINSLCFYSQDLADERTMSLMSEENFGIEHDKELRDKIMKQKKTSSFGFSSLQRRIEKVKHDLFNLTNKLNSNYPESSNGTHCYYNLGIGDIIDDNDNPIANAVVKDNEIEVLEKSWKCPSQCNSKYPFSDLSESTQKILGRLHLKEDEVDDCKDFIEMNEDEIEMEEDELELTFSNRNDNSMAMFTSKGRILSIIEEQEEYESSSGESDNGKSTVIECCLNVSGNSSAIHSSSSHSYDVTDNDLYVTPMSSFSINEKKQESSDDTEEYFSDFAKCSVSSHSSKESLKCQDIEKTDVTFTETTIKADPDHLEQISEDGSSLQEQSSSIKDEEDFRSEAEYDNSGWSTEDIPQSAEQSDSIYDKLYRPMLKSSLPDLLESSDSYDIDNIGRSLITRHYNKSTDLDEILDQMTPYHHTPSDGRLSQSLCNLFTTRSNKAIRPDDFFQERASFDNLLETDLDSGYVSIYKPVLETEILPKVEFSCSMGNVNDIEEVFRGIETPLINKLRKKAGSVTELRIADSLTKLNIPEWLNLRDDEECGILYDLDSNLWSLPIQRSQTLFDKTNLSLKHKLRSLPREVSESNIIPIIKPNIKTSIVLPSQLLRQASQRKLIPIEFCQARKLLLPNKVSVNDNK